MPRVAAVRDDPATVWAALAPLLAGQPRVRISPDGGRNYPQRYERQLTEALPSKPAAVRIFGKDGTCRALFLDFDSSVDGEDRVLADVRLVTEWLYRHGARWIEDHSPNGGRHIYVPLAERVIFSEARDLVEALGTRHRSLDKSPHQNISHGCIRVPGSVHKTGGHQMLDMSLAMAYDIARRPNGPEVWQKLTSDLKEEIAAVRALRLETVYSSSLPETPELVPTATGSRMSRTMLAIAASGIYDAARYSSPSEARQAVLVAAAAAGMELLEVERRMKQGTWPGLAQMYAKYRSGSRFKAIQREWRKAVRHVLENPRKEGQDDSARKYSTSQPTTQPGLVQGNHPGGLAAEHRWIRTWRNALTLREQSYTDSRSGLARRMILRALGAAAHMTGSRLIEFGTRSLAVASGVEHTTVSSHLRALREEKEPLIQRVREAKGTRGDLYELSMPESLAQVSESVAWRKGKLHALRPAFRALGMPAAFIYEALENAPGRLTTTELVRLTGISRTTASEALEILAAWNLVERDPETRTWSVVAGTSLAMLAEHFGVNDDVAAQLRRYKEERIAWRQWLAGRALVVPFVPSPGDDYPWETFEGPPDEVTLADLAFNRRPA